VRGATTWQAGACQTPFIAPTLIFRSPIRSGRAEFALFELCGSSFGQAADFHVDKLRALTLVYLLYLVNYIDRLRCILKITRL
jgi:hypothetical protein